MQNGLDMDTGSKNIKIGIFAAIALAFGVGAFAALGGGGEKPAAAPVETADASATSKAGAPADPAVASADPAAPADAADAATAAPAATDIASAASTPAEAPAPAAAPVPAAKAAPATAPSMAEAPAPAAADASSGEASKVASADDGAHMKAVRKPAPAAGDALRAWWEPDSKADFNVQYVGQAADQQAMVIRFSKNVADPAAAAQHIKVLGPTGQPVAGNWQVGVSPYVIYQTGLAPGRYNVTIDPTLKSAQGQQLASSLNGPIYIQ